MLVKCPECSHQVSDKALACPCCGYPISQSSSKPKPPRRKAKYKRLPNGFGQISEIKNQNLRSPFRAMVTVGHNKNGRPICKPLKPQAYFKTYNEAYAALMEYHQHPFDLTSSITCDDLFNKWKLERYGDNKTQLAKAELLWKYCTSVYSLPVRDLRVYHIKDCVYNGIATIGGKEKTPNSDTSMRIKVMFGLMLDYALEYDLIEKNYARVFTLDRKTAKDATTVKNGHKAFSEEEFQKLWDNVNNIEDMDMILIQCYSGWRPRELCELRLENIDVVNGYMVGGMKTEAGKNRTVPIHPKIKELVNRRYCLARIEGSSYLFNYYNKKKGTLVPYTYTKYKYMYDSTMSKLKMGVIHTPHDCRKHFVTMAKEAGLDEYAIKYIVGHSIKDLTEKTYTERKPEWLKQEIEKIK